MRLFYDAALIPLRGAAWVYGLWPRGTPEATLERDQRVARRLPAAPPGSLWLHGASLGESRLVVRLASELAGRRPGGAVVASAVTRAGRDALEASTLAGRSFFLPLDFPDLQRRVLAALRPGALALVETEIWPALLAEAARARVPACLVNGRIAPERLGRYRRFAAVYRPALASLTRLGAASDVEAERFAELGARAEALRVTGNLKFDLPAPGESAEALRARFALAAARPVFVAGSTGAGEDAPVVEAFLEARRSRPGAFLVLAPRHAARFDGAFETAAARGLAVHRLSAENDAAAGAGDVLLVDVLGRLAELYALGEASFVGGSLVPVGGHNLLEPLAAGSPVVFGPHLGHVREVADAVLAEGAGEVVPDATALARAWVRLAGDPAERARRVAAGRALIARHRGALGRSVDLILETLEVLP